VVDAVVCGLGALLLGLVLTWLGINTARPSRAEVFDPETYRRRRRSRAERWLSFIGLMLMGVGAVCFGLLVLRYPRAVVTGVPLIDDVISVLFPVGLAGGTIALYAVLPVLQTAEKKRRVDADEP
jgi:hypothetical protein